MARSDTSLSWAPKKDNKQTEEPLQKIAIAQISPVLLNRDKTIEKAIATVAEAAAEGAELVVLPESFISGYPAWIWRLRPGSDWGSNEKLYARLVESAVDIDSGQLTPLCDSAREHKVTIVCGLNERAHEGSGATIYNCVVTIGPDGAILNRHRKLMPTNPERMVWGFGDGSSLKVVDTPVGRLGTLACWENFMPLARYALYAQGLEVHVAPTYDAGESSLGTMQHIAREGRCWVICAGTALASSDIPADFPDRDKLYPNAEEWINPGDSMVVAPGGEVVAGPLHQQHGLLYAEIDAARVAVAKRALDVAGHYARPDIFTLHVNRAKQDPVEFD